MAFSQRLKAASGSVVTDCYNTISGLGTDMVIIVLIEGDICHDLLQRPNLTGLGEIDRKATDDDIVRVTLDVGLQLRLHRRVTELLVSAPKVPIIVYQLLCCE